MQEKRPPLQPLAEAPGDSGADPDDDPRFREEERRALRAREAARAGTLPVAAALHDTASAFALIQLETVTRLRSLTSGADQSEEAELRSRDRFLAACLGEQESASS